MNAMTITERRELEALRGRLRAAACDDASLLTDTEIDRWNVLERAAAAEEQAAAEESRRVAGLRGLKRIEYALKALGAGGP